MKVSPEVVIAAAVVWLPRHRERPDLPDGAEAGYDEVAVAEGHSGPELAVLAGEAALASSGWSGADLDLVAHAWSYHQGHDFWSPAHFVADRLGAPAALPLGVQQMCNGGAAALQTAVAHLVADPAVERALVTTGDRFCGPGFSRWTGDYGAVYGDSGTAVLLSRGRPEDARLRLLSIVTVAAPELERMNRGDDPFTPAPRWYRPAVDARATKKAFLRTSAPGLFGATEREKIRRAVTGALADACVAPDDPRLTRAVLPRLHRGALDGVYRPLLAELTTAEPVDPGHVTGHLGAGDLGANLAAVAEGATAGRGELALVLSAGAGFSWSAAVVEVV
ncbi:ketoacyl-ACP synthase III family protein [Saccharothrix variisporea]|uniref:3-oxoacyl-[acyl-carrier-protein] synthase-3 n=1 Tax=Saccharothrix variisporea TaxID=543527 RepID=A0A495WZ49_9PSEU|nr:ketoacyl-ACP synthase III family protein [Saccharothrix variisporea]RKT66880.1 3-oxoacyl-[acyl-carrier-protein] synthase-3 [Saccharothrix variisporea]